MQPPPNKVGLSGCFCQGFGVSAVGSRGGGLKFKFFFRFGIFNPKHKGMQNQNETGLRLALPLQQS